jgi:quercetin dioxygenase-like cupin family protein
MEITRTGVPTTRGPREWFTGVVHLDPVATPAGGGRLSAALVRFAPGGRTAWHTHPHGQTILVTEGVCLVQRRGAPAQVVRPGDRVFFAPDEDHWHGAAPDTFMTHLAMAVTDDEGRAVIWGAHVTDEEYARAAQGG